ncbi:MAG TPA: translation initiation factor IF-2 [Candidatus Pacebacteria bacterium]|nr:translation initiation factor IF-2 [Candidatus Paceibacterota bacterium]
MTDEEKNVSPVKSSKPIDEQLNKVKIPSTVTVKKFAKILDIPVTELITELMKNGIMATINEEIDFDTAAIIAEDLGYTVTEDLEVADDETITLEKLLDICAKEEKSDEKLDSRPPIVTILGHVDHGKTTLLDSIRKASVASGESGGITQHISAYQARKRGKLITFIDTPGHEAFAAMRERGVSIADIAVLVVAADDGVQPQTKEVIRYLTEKKIPTIVAINKIDKPNANPARVKQELAEHDIVIEEWGGNVMCNEISAKNNIGITDILESILLLAEVENFRANASRDGLAVVLESHKDPQKGPVATVVVKTGTLKVGQDVNAGKTYGRIRHMENHQGDSIEKATPSTPVTIFGLTNTAQTNDILQVAHAKKSARIKSQEAVMRLTSNKKNVKSITDNDGIPKLNIIIKADVEGSIEAIEQILGTIPQKKVAVSYIDTGVGNVTESDVRLGSSAEAIIYGFNVSVSPVAKRMADDDDVTVSSYKVIYELVDDIKSRLLAMLPDEIERTAVGELEVLGVFFTEKDKMIIGGKVTKGKVIAKDIKIDVYRKEVQIGTGDLANLQHNKVDIDKIEKGQECGITFAGDTKIKVGDNLKLYTEILKEKEL